MNIEGFVTAILRTNPVEIANRLQELGWSRDDLAEVIDAMVGGRRSCTDNDPLSAPGWMAWKNGIRRFRELGRAKGMHKVEVDGIPYVVNLGAKTRFTVANTNDGTSRERSNPQNQNRKGPATERAVAAQGELFEALAEAPPKVTRLPTAPPGVWIAWYLCVFCDGEDVRAELSCPVAIEGGYFTDFYERIFLIGPDDGGVKVRRDLPENEQDFDIPVIRRK